MQVVTGHDITGQYPAGCWPGGWPLIENHAMVDNHELGWKSGRYDAAQDAANDVQPYIDQIADIISKEFISTGTATGTPADYFMGDTGSLATICRGLFPMNNTEYDKSRHYWGA